MNYKIQRVLAQTSPAQKIDTAEEIRIWTAVGVSQASTHPMKRIHNRLTIVNNFLDPWGALLVDDT
jgi:hypothetical protein